MKTKMNQYVRMLYDQIGKEAFFMMNARNITANNQQNAPEMANIRFAYLAGLRDV